MPLFTMTSSFRTTSTMILTSSPMTSCTGDQGFHDDDDDDDGDDNDNDNDNDNSNNNNNNNNNNDNDDAFS